MVKNDRIAGSKDALAGLGARKPHQSDAFVAKLAGYGPLHHEDEARLRAACRQTRAYPAGHDLIRESDTPGPVFVVLKGWVVRYKILPDGNRQIIAFMLPGDFCDMHVAVLDQMDHSVGTLTRAIVATIQRSEMEVLVDATPMLARAFWWTQLVEAAMLRSTIISIGRRSSLERVAHLLCELCFRVRNVSGAMRDESYVMPFTQIVLSDAVGLTPVHLNRVIRKLRLARALEIEAGSIVIADLPTLARVAGFDDTYLHGRLATGT